MTKISNLNELYDLLESMNYLNYHETKKSMEIFLKENSDKDDERKIWCEHTCLSFRINKSEIKGFASITDKNGKIIEIPNLNEFTDDDMTYIKSRMNKTDNNLLKFIYSSVVCNKTPHQNIAKICIDSSWTMINTFEENILNETIRTSSVINILLNSYTFSFKFDYKKEKIKDKIIEFIFNENFWNEKHYMITFYLIEHVLAEKKNFKDLTNIDEVCWKIATKMQNLKRYQRAIDLLELGEKVDNKLQRKQYKWRLEIAKIYELQCEVSKDNLKPYFAICAIENYKKAGKPSKVEKITEKYSLEYSNMFEYGSFRVKIENYEKSLGLIFDYADTLVNNNDSDYILKYLMQTPELKEHYKSSKEFVKSTKNELPLLFMFPTVLIDSDGMIFGRYETEEEKENHNIMYYYSKGIIYFYLPFITRIINKAYLEEKITPNIILNYLNEHSWLGQTFIPQIGENIFFSMIIPAINSYFNEWELSYVYNIPQPHFVLTIDSLILKLEGIIKLIYKMQKPIKKPTKKSTLEDKNLNDILEDDEFNLLPKEDLFFLRYLLIDKTGLNLRNKVAHSIMKKEDYNISNANLLIVALLKLCAFELILVKDKIET